MVCLCVRSTNVETTKYANWQRRRTFELNHIKLIEPNMYNVVVPNDGDCTTSTHSNRWKSVLLFPSIWILSHGSPFIVAVVWTQIETNKTEKKNVIKGKRCVDIILPRKSNRILCFKWASLDHKITDSILPLNFLYMCLRWRRIQFGWIFRIKTSTTWHSIKSKCWRIKNEITSLS